MSKLLVIYSEDWADEFQVSGFQVMDEITWNQYVDTVNTLVDWPAECYFGTNEFQKWHSAEEHLSNFTVKPITDEQAVFLGEHFTSYGSQGHFLMVELDDYSVHV